MKFSNNQNDYKKMYDKYVNQMYSYGMALGVDEDMLYDLIHDVFLHLFEYDNEITEGENEKFYLFRCLKNRLITKQRKQIDFAPLKETDEYSFSITVSGIEFEEEEERREITLKIEEMLECLTDRQREAVYLRFTHELEYHEIAVLLGLTTKGTRKLIYRAFERIREQYPYRPEILFLLFTKLFLF